MLLLRFLSGLIGIPLLIVLVFVGGGFPFILGVGVLSIIGLNEFYQGVRKTGAEPQEWVGLASAFLFLFSARNQFQEKQFSTPGVLTLFVIATLCVELLRPKRAPVKNLGATLFGAVYVGWLFSYLVAINSVQGASLRLDGIPFDIRHGAWLVLYTWLRLQPQLDPADAYETACRLASGASKSIDLAEFYAQNPYLDS